MKGWWVDGLGMGHSNKLTVMIILVVISILLNLLLSSNKYTTQSTIESTSMASQPTGRAEAFFLIHRNSGQGNYCLNI